MEGLAGCDVSDEPKGIEVRASSKYMNKDATPDYIYIGGKMPKQFVAGQSYIVDYNVYFKTEYQPPTGGTTEQEILKQVPCSFYARTPGGRRTLLAMPAL